MPEDPKIAKAILNKYFINEKWEDELTERTAELKRMARYCDCSILELENLPLSLYLLIKRDSWLESMRSSEEGREVLKNIWRLQQTEADIEKIRAKGVKQI